MANKKTLYVIGAGASSEANLPTGRQLKIEIAELLDITYKNGYSQSSGDKYIPGALRIHIKQSNERDINSHLHACWHIRDALPQAISIDNFIDTHNDDMKIELCGKLAIVQAILKAEKNSLLYIDNSNIYNKLNFSKLEDTWYSSFMMLLTENCTIEELPERLRSIALIIFNYDRCLEHFLYYSFQNYFGITAEKSAALVNEIEIYHPYGMVGCLPWQKGQSVNFGAQPYQDKLLELAKQIKTFTEGTDPSSSEILAIRKNILDADKIVFLGFAFHKQNMKLMAPEIPVGEDRFHTTYYGTAKGISESDCIIIRTELEAFKQPTLYSSSGVNINRNLCCSSLFSEYWRSLSFS